MDDCRRVSSSIVHRPSSKAKETTVPVVRRSSTGPLRPPDPNVQTGILSSQTGILSTTTGALRTSMAMQPPRSATEQSISQLRQRLHSKIIAELRDSVDLSDDLGVRREIERLFGRYMAEEDMILNRTERGKLQNQVIAEIL